MDVLSKAISAAREWERGQTIRPPPSTTKHPLPIVPLPNADTIILRTDPAWQVSSLTAGMGCISFKKKEWVASSQEQGNHFSSLELRNSINNGNSLPELYGVVADILCTSTSFVSIAFVWISRENNMAADLLAKQCLSVGVEQCAPP
ncbi:hypothetical protein Rs2_29487 [Raphanus sativus]|nr:hypothetical protein Rs2_29487 [Raphanus sativus]